jgi:WD40 repeat protein
MADPRVFRPVRALNPRISTRTERVVLRALALRRDQRYKTAREMSKALQQAPDSPTPSLLARVPRWVWIGAGLGSVGMIVVGLLIALWVTGLGNGATNPTQPPSATAEFPVLAGTPLPEVAAIAPENADRVEQLAQWGKGTFFDITYGPGGERLAVRTTLGIELYDTGTLELVGFIDTSITSRFRSLPPTVFSRDGSLIGTSTTDGVVQLWSANEGSLERSLRGRAGDITDLAFSSDDAELTTVSEAGVVQVWQVSDGTLLDSREGFSGEGTLSDDGGLLALSSCEEENENGYCQRDSVEVWRLAEPRRLYVLDHFTRTISSLAFSPDGSTLATSTGTDDMVQVWNATDGVPVRTLGRHEHVDHLAFSPDGTMLASAGTSSSLQEIKVWRLSDGALLETVTGGMAVFSPDNHTLATSGPFQHAVRLHQIETGQQTGVLNGYGWVLDWALSPDKKELASVVAGGALRIRRIQTGEMVLDRNTVTWPDAVSFSENGTSVTIAGCQETFPLFGCTTTEIQQRRTTDGRLTTSFESPGWDEPVVSPSGAVVSLEESCEGLFSNCEVTDIRLVDAGDGTVLQVLEDHPGSVTVAFSPDGSTVASQAADNNIRLWRVSDGSLMHVVEGRTMCFSSDGRTLASRTEDGDIAIWRVSDGSKLHELDAELRTEYPGFPMAFSPDGQMLAAPLDDTHVQLWRVDDAMLVHTLSHPEDVSSVVFSPDGGIVATADGNGEIRLWRADDGGLLSTLAVDSGLPPEKIDFSPDGTLLISGGWGDVIRLWGVPAGR